jgi:metallo-beta-lactamase class B
MRISAFVLIFVLFAAVIAQKNDQDRAWNQPVEPFRIVGNIYYVGARDITSYLITTPKGHILIDSGFIETVPQISVNVLKLGFKLEDVKILLNSHAHYDHAGGLAELRRLTGAKLMISDPDVELLENGGKGDPNFGDRFPFEGVRADRSFGNGERIKLGGVTLTANITPGHTRGCTTWTTETLHKGRKITAVFVCSTSAPGYKLFRNEKYPNIYTDYARTFDFLEKLRPDIFLGSHGAIYGLEEKIGTLRSGRDDAFIDPDGYKKYVAASRAAIEEAFKRQSAP